jgi:hypothetical protein
MRPTPEGESRDRRDRSLGLHPVTTARRFFRSIRFTYSSQQLGDGTPIIGRLCSSEHQIASQHEELSLFHHSRVSRDTNANLLPNRHLCKRSTIADAGGGESPRRCLCGCNPSTRSTRIPGQRKPSKARSLCRPISIPSKSICVLDQPKSAACSEGAARARGHEKRKGTRFVHKCRALARHNEVPIVERQRQPFHSAKKRTRTF